MKTDKKFGLGFLIVGLVLILINYLSISFTDYFYPKMLIVGLSVSMFGIAMVLFPGGDIPENTPNGQKINVMFKGAPLLSKIMWVAFAAAGVIGGFWWCIQQGWLDLLDL